MQLTVLHKSETGSTMDDARHALRSGYGSWTLCRADRQAHGRGRVPGRRWTDEGGKALLFTLILHKSEISSPYPLTQLLALSLCRRLEGQYGLAPGIKWPNDVLVSGKKIAGILVESEGEYLLAGMGVNIGQCRFPSGFQYPAVSLGQLSSPTPSLDSEMYGLAAAIARVLKEQPGIEEVERRLCFMGQEVRVSLGNPDSPQILKGEMAGLGADGSLEIRENTGGITPVYSGEIHSILIRGDEWEKKS